VAADIFLDAARLNVVPPEGFVVLGLAGQLLPVSATHRIAQVGQSMSRGLRRTPINIRSPHAKPAIAAHSDPTYHYQVILLGNVMEATSVTSKGQVTIPKEVRQRLGIRQGTRIEFALVGDHAVMRVSSSPFVESASGFGMLKSRRAALPVDFDPATLAKR